MGDITEDKECITSTSLIAFLYVSGCGWARIGYGLEEVEDEIWGVGDEMFRMVIYGVNCEDSIFADI